ncbi:MAG: sensor histidine kinase [Thermaceae bacterium]|nr:sensor histidine kinase [Thermaceae bacterium]
MLARVQGFFLERPVARVVAFFTALNLLTVLGFTLLVPARPITLSAHLPINDPTQTAVRVGAALGLYALVLWGVRPGVRRVWELLVLALVGALVLGTLTHYYLPFLALGLIPVVARYWMPLWAVLLLVAGIVALSAWWATHEPLQITFEIVQTENPRGGGWSVQARPTPYPNLGLAFFVFIAFLFAGYSLFALEVLVREARAKEELWNTRRELLEASRQTGILEERQRLAREIHDTLAQNFASIVVQLEAAEAAAENETSAGRYLEQARNSAREGLSEARRMVWALRPEILENASLPEALSRLLRRWQEESRVEATLTVTGDPRPLHPELEVSLLRIAQEALANVRKHSQAKTASVTLSYLDDLVLMDIQDDGVGLQPALVGSFGLRSMRERVERLGGVFTLESERGLGTILAVSLPLEPPVSPAEVVA